MDVDDRAADEFDVLAAKAEAALSGGDWATAAAAYEDLVRANPTHAELKYKLAAAYEELGRLQDAVALLNHPSIADLEKTKRRLAKLHIEAKDFQAATPLVEELLNASPGNPKFLKWKALCEAKDTDEYRISRQLQQGQELVSADRLDEAERLYLGLLAEHPEAARAYFYLGQVYAQQKRWADAIPALRNGSAIEPDNGKMKASLARALFKEGRPGEAIHLLDRLRSDEIEVNDLWLLQRCHAELRDWSRVDEVGSRLLAILPPEDPLRTEVTSLREDAQFETDVARVDAIAAAGNPDLAISSYRDLTARHPERAAGWLKLGAALADAGRDDDAGVVLREALTFHPENLDIRRALTRSVIATSNKGEVLRHVRDSVDAGLGDLESYRWLARYHADHDDWPSSLENARNALAIEPDHASSRMLAARALIRLGRLPEALEGLDALLALGAKQVEALQLKADIFVQLGRLRDAIDLYRQALEASPKHPLISHKLSCALLLNGDVEGFHRFHEKRRERKSFIQNNKERPYQDWNGELSIDGKLLVWSEFGLGVGPSILHMAFLEPLSGLGLDLVVEVEPRLVEICRRSFPRMTIIGSDEQVPGGISHHTPIGSLSRWFKPDLASFGSARPYLAPDGDSVAGHRARLKLAAGAGDLLVGIAWAADDEAEAGAKSVQLDPFLDAIMLPGVTLVNLQDGDHSQAAKLAEARTGKRLLDSGIDNGADLDGLAAVIAAMDLVVCVDHRAAHIAGAVGVPNYVLLSAAPAPFWLAQGEQCIWYPATTLVRRAPVDDGWQAALAQVRDAVRDFAEAHDRDSWLAGTLVQDLRPLSIEPATLTPSEIRDAVSAFVAQGPFAPGAYRSALELIGRLPENCLSREVQMQRARLLARFGHWEEARRVYLALRSPDGADPEMDEQILSVSLAMYDLGFALTVALRLARDEPSYHLTAANILFRLRRHDEALAELSSVSVEAPQTEGVSTLLGTILLEMAAFERAEAYLVDQAAMMRRVEDYTLLGRSISAQGRHEEAMGVFEKGLALSPDDPAANFWRTQERIRLGRAAVVPLPPLLGDMPQAAPDDVVIFFVADNGYFWEHGLVLLASIGRRSPRAKCHVHIINPDEGVAPAVEVIRRTLPDLGLSYSFEHVDFEGCGEDHVRTYYASVRFVRLAEIIGQAPAIYLCVDTDGIIRGDVAQRPFGPEKCDVGIRMRYDERPHVMVAAGALFLRPTPAARTFIDRVSALIRSTLEAREAVWFLDQIVLSHVLRELGEDEVAVCQLDTAFLDWFFHDESLIWTGKGPRKFEDARYTGELSQHRYLQALPEISRLMPASPENS